jgi:hypothetical protein
MGSALGIANDAHHQAPGREKAGKNLPPRFLPGTDQQVVPR